MFNENDFNVGDAHKISGVLVKAGKSTNDRGEVVELTTDIVKQIYADLIQRDNIALGYTDMHDGEEIAKLLKYELSEDGNEIRFKGIVHDPKKYYSKYNSGFKYTSPDLDIHRSGEEIIHGQLTGASMSINPGMVQELTRVESMNFSAPENENKSDVVDWSGPFNTLTSKVDEIGKMISDMGAKQMTNDEDSKVETSSNLGLSMDSIKELIREVVADTVKTAISANEQPEIKDESKAATSDVNIPSGVSPELADQFSALITRLEEIESERVKLESENRSFKDEKAKQQREEYISLLQKGRDLGIEKPEDLVSKADLSEDQKIAILKSTYKAFAQKNPLESPPKAPMSGENLKQKDTYTIDSILSDIGISPNSREFKDLALKTGLFDSSGHYIGYN